MEIIRVLLVEDDSVWAMGISDLLRKQEDIGIVGTAGDHDTALNYVRELRPDVSLIDVGLGEHSLSGLELAKEICGMQISRVIMLTSMDEREVMLDALSAGAVNYITKWDYKDVPDAVRSAYHNRSAIHPCCSGVLRDELARLRRMETDSLLSPAEKGILSMIRSGQTHAQISESLAITERTIKNHINRILKKLKANSGKEAAEKAAKKGLLDAIRK